MKITIHCEECSIKSRDDYLEVVLENPLLTFLGQELEEKSLFKLLQNIETKVLEEFLEDREDSRLFEDKDDEKKY